MPNIAEALRREPAHCSTRALRRHVTAACALVTTASHRRTRVEREADPKALPGRMHGAGWDMTITPLDTCGS